MHSKDDYGDELDIEPETAIPASHYFDTEGTCDECGRWKILRFDTWQWLCETCVNDWEEGI